MKPVSASRSRAVIARSRPCRNGHCWACCKANRPRPGHWLKEPMARRAFWACHATSRRHATTSAKRAPTYARPRRSPCALRPALSDRLDIDYGRCIVCQLCTEACPTGAMTTSSDWAFGVRSREDLIWRDGSTTKFGHRRRSAASVPAQPAHSPCRCRLMQRLRIRAAGFKQSVLQPASAWHLLYCLAALCRPTVGYRAGHATPCSGRLRATYEAMAEPRWVLAAGTCAVSGGIAEGGYACGSRARWRYSGRCLSARLSTQSGGNHPSPADVS